MNLKHKTMKLNSNLLAMVLPITSYYGQKTAKQTPTSGKGNIIFLFVALSLCFCIGQSHAQSDSKQDKLLRRTLVFTFKKTSADSIMAVDNACIELSKISAVKAFEWGVVKSGDQAKQVKHIYVFSYASEKDIETYAKSPQHDNLIKVAGPVLDTVIGFDYWAK